MYEHKAIAKRLSLEGPCFENAQVDLNSVRLIFRKSGLEVYTRKDVDLYADGAVKVHRMCEPPESDNQRNIISLSESFGEIMVTRGDVAIEIGENGNTFIDAGNGQVDVYSAGLVHLHPDRLEQLLVKPQ